LHVIKMWSTAAVEDAEQRGQKKGTTRTATKGVACQGSALSPPLSNFYTRRFVLGWKRLVV